MPSAERILVDDLLANLAPDERSIVTRLAREPAGLSVEDIGRALTDRLLGHLPGTLSYDATRRRLGFGSPDLSALFRDALAAQASPPTTGQIDPETIPRLIAEAHGHGDPDEALRLLREGGGPYYMHFHGMEACLAALENFPDAMLESEETLVLTFAMYALKSGNVSRARHLVVHHLGAEARDLKRVLANPERYSRAFRLFRFLMTIYEDVPITDAMRAQLFDVLGEVPLDDHLQRGSFYNAMLEVLVRKRELDAAGEVARRARFHYGKANAHLLGFYIDLYQTILCLMNGALTTAETHARDAQTALDRVSFDTHADARLLGLIKAVIRYEQGDVQTLVRFLNEEFDAFAYGELWPTVAEIAINYGAQALSRHIAVAAGRVFLDKWRIQEWRSNRFRLLITLREVTILQSGNRWQEAADLLTAVQSRINRTWVESAVENLLRLVDAQEIALTMAWLRHLIWEVPTRAILRDQLAELLRNDHLSERQRITVRIWAAHLARLDRDMTAARSAVLKALEASARMGTIMPLVEEAGLLDRLLGDKRIREFALVSGDTRQIVRRLKTMDASTTTGPRRAGLTRQEVRVLLLVVEGGTNKYVARQLGLSEVTVKFHLSNIYRKTGCSRRAEAIATAKALGWVA